MWKLFSFRRLGSILFHSITVEVNSEKNYALYLMKEPCLHFQKCHFWTNLVQKLKIVSLCWNLGHRPTQICRIQWWYSLLVSNWNFPFEANWVQKIKIDSLSWNLLARLILIRRNHCWYSLFLFKTRNTLFAKI